ncbi:hypothetical protein [Streptomyces sp. RFCAC02]|uniref:hypothetical protein n=1 Tax=Streptomyces sp. RFCAC02 TaxID=2499143 RepID=UPI00102200AF|nr:hypothetical protein [Streptomyces sp. RFCAC02]
MNGITLTLRALHHAERSLEKDLLGAAERHATEHEVHHVAKDLARWSREHAARLADTGGAYGLDLQEHGGRGPGALLSAVRERAAEALGHRPEPGLLLLHDLRELYLAASGVSLYWEMLAQAAQAAKDARLLEMASSCHPETLRQVRWANTHIKVLSPQILTGPL